MQEGQITAAATVLFNAKAVSGHGERINVALRLEPGRHVEGAQGPFQFLRSSCSDAFSGLCQQLWALFFSERPHVKSKLPPHSLAFLSLTNFRTSAALGSEMPLAKNPHPVTGKAFRHMLSSALETLHLSATSSFRPQLIQADLGVIVGLVLDHCNQVNYAIKLVTRIFWFPRTCKNYVYTIL